MSCKAITTPDSLWSFCPSLGANILFLVLFTLTTVAHLAQAVYHRAPYCWVIVVSGICQVLTYALRAASILDPANFPDYAAWFVIILVAPLWTNAFVYMVFGRMVQGYTVDHQIWRVKARYFTLIFVILDIVSFIIQVGGAVQASAQNAPYDQTMLGLHIYMGGVGIQQLFIFIFCAFSFRMFSTIYQSRARQPDAHTNSGLILLSTLFLVLLLITIRIIFRICEYSQGLHSSVPNHEVYQYCLDSLPMFLALVAFNIIHPGRVMVHKDAEIELTKQGASGRDMGVSNEPAKGVV